MTAKGKLRLVAQAAPGAWASARSSVDVRSESPPLVREMQSVFNHFVYSCACWIGRLGRARLEAAVRP
jgi:hypothetical protein